MAGITKPPSRRNYYVFFSHVSAKVRDLVSSYIDSEI